MKITDFNLQAIKLLTFDEFKALYPGQSAEWYLNMWKGLGMVTPTEKDKPKDKKPDKA